MLESVMADFTCEKAVLLQFRSQHKGTMQQHCGRGSGGSAMHSSIFKDHLYLVEISEFLSREHKSLGETKRTDFKPFFFVKTMSLHNT